jgi:xanthine/CO dehydrogenase XdhC/CoxF family maturation factor
VVLVLVAHGDCCEHHAVDAAIEFARDSRTYRSEARDRDPQLGLFRVSQGTLLFSEMSPFA